MKNKKSLIAAIILAVLAVVCFIAPGYTYIGAGLLLAAVVILIFRKAKRTLRRVLALLLAVCVLAFVIIEIPVIQNAATDAPEGCDYIIVLGAGLFGETPSLSLRTRLEAARDYLLENPDTVAVVSGGQGEDEDITEAEAMRRYLENAGIEPERIIMEPDAKSTAENLEFSFDIIASRGDENASVAVVSSMYHLYRAKELASSMGREVCGVAAPMGYPIVTLNYFIREGFARIYTMIFGVS